MTEREKLMYQIMGRISESDAPIVFKGAMVTKFILATGGYTDLDRQTKDIDANWIGAPPSMGDLEDAINRSLGGMREQYFAVAFRNYGEKKSAGISIRSKDTDEEAFSMDISIKPVSGSMIYRYGEISIRGVLANEILADKLTVMSTRMLFRRAKDMVDVYALTHCVEVRIAEMFEMFRKRPEREVGSFAEFLTRRADVEHAYNKLSGVSGKPAFDKVYSYLGKFLHPFVQRDETPKVWNSESLAWEDEPQKKSEKQSVRRLIQADREAQRWQPGLQKKKSTQKNDPER
jgi:hypothetical protein